MTHGVNEDLRPKLAKSFPSFTAVHHRRCSDPSDWAARPSTKDPRPGKWFLCSEKASVVISCYLVCDWLWAPVFDQSEWSAALEQTRMAGRCRKGGSRVSKISEAPATMKHPPIVCSWGRRSGHLAIGRLITQKHTKACIHPNVAKRIKCEESGILLKPLDLLLWQIRRLSPPHPWTIGHSPFLTWPGPTPWISLVDGLQWQPCLCCQCPLQSASSPTKALTRAYHTQLTADELQSPLESDLQ
jgi:hypothetical protein